MDDDGKKHVDTPAAGIVGTSAASGALWGMLIGLLFLVPGVGLILGGLWGARVGRLGKAGIDGAFRDRVEGLLEPGKAALVVLATKLTEDKFNAGPAGRCCCTWCGVPSRASTDRARSSPLAANVDHPRWGTSAMSGGQRQPSGPSGRLSRA